MTHSELSAACARPPGWPPSECPGELVVAGSVRFDAAQEGEGDVGTDVRVLTYECSRCGEVVVVSHGANGWRLRNTYEAR